jgi:large subunit ribosomal protein L18
MRLLDKIEKRKLRRKKSIRSKISGTSERLRLSVYKSIDNIYVQLIDDIAGKTVLSSSSVDSSVKKLISNKMNKTEISKIVGTSIAEKAKSANIDSVVFDRNGCVYHGRVKALADAAREGGLKF